MLLPVPISEHGAEDSTFGDFSPIWPISHGGKGVDVVCQHGRFDAEAMESMVGPKAFHLTILRNPISQFLSLWNFYSMREKFRKPLNSWLISDRKM